MSELKVNQHYVPRSYLKRFSIEDSKGKKIMLYNIEFNKIEKDKSIANVASERSFYDSEVDGFISNRYSTQGSENTLADLESLTTDLFNNLERSLQRGIALSSEELERIAYILYVQYVRTKVFREVNFKSVTDEYSVQAQIALGISQPGIFDRAIRLFKNRRYIIAEPYRGIHFVTSDNPVALITNINIDLENEEETRRLIDKHYKKQEFEDIEGIDFAIPLSRFRVLIGVDVNTSSLKLVPGQTYAKLSETYSNNVVGAVAIGAYKYIFGSKKEDLQYAVRLLEWKRDEIAKRTPEEKNRINQILSKD